MSSVGIEDGAGTQDDDAITAAVEKAVQTKRRRRRCDCDSADACFACNRCLEQHCVCGSSVTNSLCRESQACNCRVHEPATRCGLCFGCRQLSGGYSHCRCVQHQLASCVTADELPSAEGDCKCFQRTTKKLSQSPKETSYKRRRLVSIARRAGLPSSQGIYASKVKDPRVAIDQFGESGEEASDSETDDVSTSKTTKVDELETVLPPFTLFRLQPRVPEIPPQRLLQWSRTKSYQESIDPSATNFVKPEVGFLHKMTTATTDRILDNAQYAQDRTTALPSEDMIEYIISTASIKTSRMPELIGSFENTAAVAVGVVLEEYTKQLVARSERESLCNSTKDAVQAFTRLVLQDFNYGVYLTKRGLPSMRQLSAEQALLVEDELVQLVSSEYASVQHETDRESLTDAATYNQISILIREIVTGDIEAARTSVLPPTDQDDAVQCVKEVKLVRKASKLTGQHLYKYDLAADVGDRHRAVVTIDGFESQQAATRSMARMKKALKAQDERLDLIEHPRPPPEDPIIAELYAQLLSQVRQSRAQQAAANESRQ